MATMLDSETYVLQQAQAGQLLSDYIGLRADRLPGFRPRPERAALNGEARLRIIETLTKVIKGAYCHLPQKRAAYAIDPVQALNVFRGRALDLSDSAFHLALTGIITTLRDAHTMYSGPKSDDSDVAALPFLVEQYGPFDSPRFIVSKVCELDADLKAKGFVRGAELLSWNTIPFARAVDIYADWETGGRPDARRARALESLTFRALEHVPPPDEMSVELQFCSPGGKESSVRIPWRVVSVRRAADRALDGSLASRSRGIDPAGEHVRRAKKLLFSGEVWKADQARRPTKRGEQWLETSMPDVFAARNVAADVREIGYLRIWSFDVDDDEAFVDEMSRLLDLLSPRGVILDLRGNPGGLIWAAERALQLFTPNRIAPTRFSLLATDLTREMASSPFNRMEFERWLPSLETSISTGEPYSQPLPLTDPEWCNDRGQCYSGPVVCVVDPNTYSSGDLFAAGFVDNQIGPIVSVGEGTGGGGANVWTHHNLREALEGTSFPLDVLPQNVGYSLAIRRAIRSGPSDGVPIEDLGVPGIPYVMTEVDLLGENEDLVKFCARQLNGVRLTDMRVTVCPSTVVAETRGLDQLETYVEGLPAERARSLKEEDRVELPRPADRTIEFVGRRNGEILQRRRKILNRHQILTD